MSLIPESPPELPPLIGEAPSFRAVLAQVSQLAALDRPVLVIGERGTGKELIAARLTYLSPRWDKPFLTLNCATLAEALLDSELFGHEAGAFTGAARRRLSGSSWPTRATLFLDEIASASAAVQEKILRVIEYGAFERVGGSEVHRVDVRVIAAANVDLPALAAAGRFRSDLLDRLAFDVVTLPPLRDRPEDIPLLAEHFARAMTRTLGRDTFAGFTADALARLMDYRWPGNVRELRNAVERSLYRAPRPDAPLDAIILDPFASPHRPATPVQAPAAVPAAASAIAEPAQAASFTERVNAFEAGLLRAAISAHRFNQRRAAEALGLTYHQLRHYLKKHALLGGT